MAHEEGPRPETDRKGRAVVAIADVVEALEMASDEVDCFLDPETGEVVSITGEEAAEAEGLDSFDDLPEADREHFSRVKEILDSNRWLPLPDRFEIRESSILRRFAAARTVAKERDWLESHGLQYRGGRRDRR